MSFAALFWSLAAVMQGCMLSQFGQKHLKYDGLNQNLKRVLSWLTALFLVLSLLMNCHYEGSSVGPLTWLFVILTTAFFLQVLSFYLFRKYFILIWLGAIIFAFIFTALELLAFI